MRAAYACIRKVAGPTARSSSPARRAPARSSRRARSTTTARAPRGRSSRSTARRCPRRCSRASSSATSAARSPAPSRESAGSFEIADGGTLFLDEIGDMPPALQAQAAARAPGARVRARRRHAHDQVDVRVIAATNGDLEAAVAAGRFREDLYYRLNVVTLDMPPLRARRDDIPPLARHFAAKYAARRAVGASRREPLDALHGLRWPGNVRELENAIERAVVLGCSDRIVVDDLPRPFARRRRRCRAGRRPVSSECDRDEAAPDPGRDRSRGGNCTAAARFLASIRPTCTACSGPSSARPDGPGESPRRHAADSRHRLGTYVSRRPSARAAWARSIAPATPASNAPSRSRVVGDGAAGVRGRRDAPNARRAPSPPESSAHLRAARRQPRERDALPRDGVRRRRDARRAARPRRAAGARGRFATPFRSRKRSTTRIATASSIATSSRRTSCSRGPA